jgi:hypothetical protein
LFTFLALSTSETALELKAVRLNLNLNLPAEETGEKSAKPTATLKEQIYVE